MKNLLKKMVIKLPLSILLIISVIYFLQEIRDAIDCFQREPSIKNYIAENEKSNYIKRNIYNDYVHINKDCTICINNRKGNAGCIVSKDKRILLVRYRRTNQISFPGGFGDYQHKDTFTASEEMRQALGYIVSIEDLIADFNYLFRRSSRENFRLYKCNIIKKTNKTNNKILEEMWVSKEELNDIIQNRNKEIAFNHELKVVYDKFDFITKI